MVHGSRFTVHGLALPRQLRVVLVVVRGVFFSKKVALGD